MSTEWDGAAEGVEEEYTGAAEKLVGCRVWGASKRSRTIGIA
jgi:hypothetical protein